jgi:hypothetical protein
MCLGVKSCLSVYTGAKFISLGERLPRMGFKMKCDFCNRNKETIKTAIEYKGNDVFKFDSLVLTFDLCAQCVGENLSAVNGFAKAGA